VKRVLKFVFIGLAVIFAALQLFRIDQTNPAVVPGESIESVVSVSPDVSQILSRSCNDCHSHKTNYPWYANISPFSMFLEDHILEGRQQMNLSKFATYSRDKQVRLLEESCDEATARHMPLPSYLWIHRGAALTDSQIAALCGWTRESIATLEATN
jgi:hypothetical protein